MSLIGFAGKVTGAVQTAKTGLVPSAWGSWLCCHQLPAAVGVTPENRWTVLRENPNLTWMMTGGTYISGNLHIYVYIYIYKINISSMLYHSYNEYIAGYVCFAAVTRRYRKAAVQKQLEALHGSRAQARESLKLGCWSWKQ